jgi:hypothetical protein
MHLQILLSLPLLTVVLGIISCSFAKFVFNFVLLLVSMIFLSEMYCWTLRWCSKAYWYRSVMGSCHLCLVSTWSIFCQWWENGACFGYLKYSIKFFREGRVFVTLLLFVQKCTLYPFAKEVWFDSITYVYILFY